MSYCKKILITGSNGMLGKDLTSLFSKNDNFEVFGINRSNDINLKDDHYFVCDITDFEELNNILKYINPEIIIHCAANVNVDGCEKDKNYAYKLNSESTKILSSYKSEKTKFIYISTDSIFNGETGNYKEDDKANPLNYYAFSKFEGENFALLQNKNAIIIRTNIYGFHKPYGSSLVEWALKNLKSENKISGFNDVYFNPIYTGQLGKIVMKLIQIDYKGIIHTGCENFINKYEFLIRIAQKFGLNNELIDESSVDSINFSARRPKNTTLNITKLKGLIDFTITLEDGLNQLYMDYINLKE
ncbi:dTDP-4-dehydrorhamnose reductase [Clostridium carboxidivorans P7]|uniref:dTDP-4-dehydrorhamnose reductase n=1 Tax=Clostridium carboxidivorans P7 TaxID=536227 RepID=C6PPI1_9CLOT|nr:SDR family oxidoreductase [Clostridium carboxidivorans]AKN33924.1 dTDP-4-dehydrorhamnose reductase [Clostridium carboxidivorans P7]EET88875.1 dTDP-4-dehydrorhamnose reductase [Clostridium carboxidivorans P7]EFG88205.1 putative dTDP-4-dehydrorhamnose reductase [Clostridium carboxidivorans P7]